MNGVPNGKDSKTDPLFSAVPRLQDMVVLHENEVLEKRLTTIEGEVKDVFIFFQHEEFKTKYPASYYDAGQIEYDHGSNTQKAAIKIGVSINTKEANSTDIENSSQPEYLTLFNLSDLVRAANAKTQDPPKKVIVGRKEQKALETYALTYLDAIKEKPSLIPSDKFKQEVADSIIVSYILASIEPNALGTRISALIEAYHEYAPIFQNAMDRLLFIKKR